MSIRSFVIRILCAAFVLSAAPLLSWAEDVEDVSVLLGKFEFQSHCAACHGVQGLGDGPIADLLKSPPANLTTISKSNGGVFPAIEVYQVIDGRRGLRAHGTTEMPIWGDRYMVETESDLIKRNIPHDQNIEAIVHGRILSLVYYIQSIQEK